MQSILETFLAGGVLAFMLTFARIGTAMMIMPGLGDTFIPERIRLHMALGLTFVIFPVVMPHLPAEVPPLFVLVSLIISEVIIGLLIGAVSRIFMMALDTAGMIISMQSGLANAQVFNPALASQGSIIGAFLTVTGILFLFVTNMHHFLIMGVVDSYNQFPLGKMPESGSMAELISQAVNSSFKVGVQMSAPFLVMTLLMYVGMGVLSRLMPQVQVFLIILPVQIFVSMILLSLMLTAIFYYWIGNFESAMLYFFSSDIGPSVVAPR